jgi:DNA-binding response OmpR family regulator
MKTRLLIVEDDPHILLGLVEVLSREGFEVATCRRGDEALKEVSRFNPRLLVLDVMLPGLSGYDICRKLRSQGCRCLILMLTAKSQEMDKVIGLDLGADDYLTKPFGLRELTARIHALLRRHLGNTERLPEEGCLRIGTATVDPKRFELRRGRTTHDLSERELKLLQFFHQHAGEVLSRDRLLTEVWGYHYLGTTRTLDQVIVSLRRKLGDVAADPRHLQTVHGVGYRLVL